MYVQLVNLGERKFDICKSHTAGIETCFV